MTDTPTDKQLIVTLWGHEYPEHPGYKKEWVDAIEKGHRDVSSVRAELMPRYRRYMHSAPQIAAKPTVLSRGW